MSITTKTGDSGETGILFGHRLPKDNLRVHTTGAIDELDAALGLARALLVSAPSDPEQADASFASTGDAAIHSVQKELVSLMGQINTLPENWERYLSAGYGVLGPECSTRLEQAIAALEAELPAQKHWSVPGAAGHPAAAGLEVARTVCRRAERHLLSLLPQIAGAPDAFHGLTYLNRLSDYLWLLARHWELPR